MSLIITPGEPAGIGPDLVLQLAQQGLEYPALVVADPELLRQRARQLGLNIELLLTRQPPKTVSGPGQLHVQAVQLNRQCIPGRPDPANSGYVLETLRIATHACLSGNASALITGPVHKAVINQAGVRFSGHTEFLADITGGHPVMMLACPGLRVALATTHLPLRDVADQITAERLEKVLSILQHDLQQRFGICEPDILVCGLNPHAGEDGHMGMEEIQIIRPVLEKLRSKGMKLHGPLPADTLFTPPKLAQADAVLAMYHDQGLPVLKHKGFGRSVNITLGLPIVRTSVDHGTALELAGTGRADSGSFHEAIAQAVDMSNGLTANRLPTTNRVAK